MINNNTFRRFTLAGMASALLMLTVPAHASYMYICFEDW